MIGNVTLRDIQPVIFENIPSMLEELDTAASAKAYSVRVTDTDQCHGEEDPNLNAMHNHHGGRGSRSDRGYRGGRHGRGGRFFRSGGRAQTPRSGRTPFCMMCFLAGSEPSVHSSHEIGQ